MPRTPSMRVKSHRGAAKLYPLNIRTTASVRLRMVAACRESGRSLASEVERRIDLSFRYEEILQRLDALQDELARQAS